MITGPKGTSYARVCSTPTSPGAPLLAAPPLLRRPGLLELLRDPPLRYWRALLRGSVLRAASAARWRPRHARLVGHCGSLLVASREPRPQLARFLRHVRRPSPHRTPCTGRCVCRPFLHRYKFGGSRERQTNFLEN